MSHKATNWAIAQRGLKPAPKIVLWQLADRYHPDNGCFPSQATLAADCEMSRSTLNVHLTTLEKAGLIKRITSVDAATHKQRPTRYKLAFEDDFNDTPAGGQPPPSRVRNPDTGPRPKKSKAVSEKHAEPCPENAESRVRNPDTNLVIEPVIEPVSEPRAREDDFSEFWDHYPHKVAKAAAKKAFEKARKKVALSDLLKAVDRYVASKPADRQWCNPAKWLSDERWTDEPAPATAGRQSFAEFMNDRAKRGELSGTTIDGEVVTERKPALRPREPTAFQKARPDLFKLQSMEQQQGTAP